MTVLEILILLNLIAVLIIVIRYDIPIYTRDHTDGAEKKILRKLSKEQREARENAKNIVDLLAVIELVLVIVFMILKSA